MQYYYLSSKQIFCAESVMMINYFQYRTVNDDITWVGTPLNDVIYYYMYIHVFFLVFMLKDKQWKKLIYGMLWNLF